MDEIFRNIDVEKKDRIINSALKEFAKNGFAKASTNIIVEQANISKGLLFHYFGSKKELYEQLEKFVINLVVNAIEDEIDWDVTDFFERIKQVAMIKGRLTKEYPYIYDFMAIMIEEKTLDNLREQTKDSSNDLENRVYKKNIDFSMFRDDLDLAKTMNIIRWTFEKFGAELMKNQNLTGIKINYQKMEQETEEYIEILKKAFYK